MKTEYKVNDYVWLEAEGDVCQIKRHHGSMAITLSNGFVRWEEHLRLVSVSDAFTLAGFAVPEDCGLIFDPPENTWGCVDDDGNCAWFGDDGWGEPDDDPPMYLCPYVSRLPVSDCLSALPTVVLQCLKKAVEET